MINDNTTSYIYDSFKLYFPLTASKTVDYRRLSLHEIEVYLDDGETVIFDEFERAIRHKPYVGASDQAWMQEFSMRLYKAILHSRIPQKEVAERAGISPSALSNYLSRRNTPTIANIRKLCNILDCPMSYLLDLE